MADPATFLASNSDLETLFSSANSLIIESRGKQVFLSLNYNLINIVNIQILSSFFFSKMTDTIYCCVDLMAAVTLLSTSVYAATTIVTAP